jgi:hypothetical protein
MPCGSDYLRNVLSRSRRAVLMLLLVLQQRPLRITSQSLVSRIVSSFTVYFEKFSKYEAYMCSDNTSLLCP